MITRKGRFLIKYEEIDSDYIANFDFEKLEKENQDKIEEVIKNVR